MGKTKIVRVDESLIGAFGIVGKSFAEQIKKKYNLEELFVSDILASQLVAGKIRGQRIFEFRVEKTGLNKGRLVLL